MTGNQFRNSNGCAKYTALFDSNTDLHISVVDNHSKSSYNKDQTALHEREDNPRWSLKQKLSLLCFVVAFAIATASTVAVITDLSARLNTCENENASLKRINFLLVIERTCLKRSLDVCGGVRLSCPSLNLRIPPTCDVIQMFDDCSNDWLFSMWY